MLLDGHPTVTLPLACGCYANVHGITFFFRQSKTSLAKIDYNLDSHLCHAEPLWIVFAEAGKKTLVWHWPGSAWPPTSENPNLMVVDGTSPGSVATAVAQVDTEFLLGANENITEVNFKEKAASDATVPYLIEDLDLEEKASKHT